MICLTYYFDVDHWLRQPPVAEFGVELIGSLPENLGRFNFTIQSNRQSAPIREQTAGRRGFELLICDGSPMIPSVTKTQRNTF